MVCNEGHVWREERLVIIVNMDRDVGPSQKGLRQWTAVEKSYLCLHKRVAWSKADTYHAFQSKHRVVLAQPNSIAPAVVLLDIGMNWHVSGGAVMLWPLKLNTTRYPWPQQPYQSRLDDILSVEEVILVGLIEASVDSPANLGKNH